MKRQRAGIGVFAAILTMAAVGNARLTGCLKDDQIRKLPVLEAMAEIPSVSLDDSLQKASQTLVKTPGTPELALVKDDASGAFVGAVTQETLFGALAARCRTTAALRGCPNAVSRDNMYPEEATIEDVVKELNSRHIDFLIIEAKNEHIVGAVTRRSLMHFVYLVGCF